MIVSLMRLLVCVTVFVLIAPSALAVTRIQVLEDGLPASGVEVTVLNATSGATIERGKSDRRGILQVDDLTPGVLYQAQSRDGLHWSEDFSDGDPVVLEIGSAGWIFAPSLGFRIGSTAQEFESSVLDATEVGIGGGPVIGLTILGAPRKVWLYGVRPFFETDLEIIVLQPDGFDDSGGGTAEIENTIRWRVGAGVSVPIRIGPYRFSVEPGVYYGLTQAELTQTGASAEDFIQHSIGADFGIVLPIGSLGSSQISIDLGAGIQVPISGSAENDQGVTGESGLDVRGTIGLRATLPELWRSN